MDASDCDTGVTPYHHEECQPTDLAKLIPGLAITWNVSMHLCQFGSLFG